MKKLLMATGTAILFSNMAIAPAFADSLSSEIEPETQYQIVLPEGEMMTDAELAEVEGEWVHIAVGAGFGAAAGYATNGFNNLRNRQSWNQGWRGATVGGAVAGGCRAGTGNLMGCGLAGSAAAYGANRAFGW
ncbi:hypothetical protein [Planktothricoides raciborskii]|uniref:Uncharacterized protein n=1 Tax=Planktothricoides raciborskii GIHE-MW2 TaxID=2792601 RepID=A0AAU8JKT7_9CYAN